MFKFYVNYPDTMSHENMRLIQGRLRNNFYEWLKPYSVLCANISVEYNEKEYADKVNHEFIVSFDLEPECYGGPDPAYHNACRVWIAKFGEEIIAYHKYDDYLVVDGMQPNAYHFDEV